MFGMTLSIPLKLSMFNVMEMKQALQAVNMRYHHHIHPVTITIITIMVLLQYFAKRVIMHFCDIGNYHFICSYH